MTVAANRPTGLEDLGHGVAAQVTDVVRPPVGAHHRRRSLPPFDLLEGSMAEEALLSLVPVVGG